MSATDRDDRLRAALQHAPDNDLAPPPDLSATIRAAAHAAVRGRAAATTPPRQPTAGQRWRAGWSALWQGLAQPRPVWGGAAALVVAGLTMSVWLSQPVPPAVVSEAPAPGAPRELPAPAAEAAADQAAPPAAQPPARSDAARPETLGRAAQGGMAPSGTRQTDARAAPAAGPAPRAAATPPAAAATSPPARATPPAPSPFEPGTESLDKRRPSDSAMADADVAPQARRKAEAAPRTPAQPIAPAAPAAPAPILAPPSAFPATPAQAPAPAPAPAPAAAKPAAAAAPVPATEAPSAGIAELARARREALDAAANRTAAPGSVGSARRDGPAAGGAPAVSGEPLRKLAAAGTPPPPTLAALLGGSGLALSDADRTLLRQLDAATRQQWRRGSAEAPGQESTPVRQWPTAGGTASLQLAGEGATWTEPDGSRFSAPLSAEALARLRNLL